MDEEIIKKVLTEYELKRTVAENKRDELVLKVYEKFPRLKEIKKEINLLGFENTKKIMANPDESKKFNEEFNKKLEKLNNERIKILTDNKIPEDFENPKYKCQKCKDTGFVGSEKCECYKEELIKKAYEKSNLGNIISDQSFDKFSLDYYSSRKKSSDELSEREIMKGIFDECVNFCETFDEKGKSLLMIGNPGLGKTFLSNCIAKNILDKGKNVIYIRATSLFTSYEDYRFGRKTDGFEYEKFYNADLLIIDDLGTENVTKSSVSFLFDLLNERFDRNKKVIINSNFSMNEISKTYSARITSRIYEFFKILHFKGDDIRIQKLLRK